MKMLNPERDRIFEWVKNHRISPEKGLALLRRLSKGDIKEHPEQETLRFFRPIWKPVEIDKPDSGRTISGDVLVFDTSSKTLDSIKKRMASSAEMVLVQPGGRFQQKSPTHYEIRPNRADDFDKLFNALTRQGGLPNRIVLLWGQDPFSHSADDCRAQLERGVYAVFHICRALLERNVKEQIDLIFLYMESEDRHQPLYAALNGFAQSLRLENPGLILKPIALTSFAEAADVILAELQAEDRNPVRYLNDRRMIMHQQEWAPGSSAVDSRPLKENGVYLITGGAGGLGIIFSDHLIKDNPTVTLVLMGRSDLSAEQSDRIDALKQTGAEIVYFKADVSVRDHVQRVIGQVKSDFNQINGVIHAAGVIRDSLLINKTLKDLDAVLAPKVFGTLFLDEATRDDPLDFFVLFSSVAAVMGSAGQCDYAYANCFMDRFAALREHLRVKRLRSGKTVSINWPLWKAGGMRVDADTETWLKDRTGMVPLTTENGIRTFQTGLRENLPQIMAVQIKAVEKEVETPKPKTDGSFDKAETDRIKNKIDLHIKGLLSISTKVPAAEIDSELPLEDFGLDSVMVMSLTRELEKDLGELSKTLFYEYQTVSELVDYFVSHHREQINSRFGSPAGKIEDRPPAGPVRQKPVPSRPRFIPKENNPIADKRGNEEVAIIGVSGRYPMAEDLETFWENLKSGKDCITEIPSDRWDYRRFFNSDRNQDGAVYTKWGGFLEDVDKFDPLLFNISPGEAEFMDPQERLFLMTAWHTLEDAGYTKSNLADSTVGVYVGVMYGEYQLFGAEFAARGIPVALNSSHGSIANRVSYHFNFNGPSIALDTMCSSSLTAVHLACESIKHGECDAALAGGVNLSIHPQKYLLLSQGKFASSDGRCRSFGQGGDGYVPGEGVGAVFLKSLSRAVADGDTIYAVIRASAVNHGGKTNGYTVPNPNAQARLISGILQSIDIDPESISYIEAHGTGTALGDPIEITGLTKAFGPGAEGAPYCSVGSVKSNIGHLESAAGIAGLTKVLLQMKYGQLVPSIHADPPNSHIRLENTPFYVQQEHSEWKPTKIEANGGEVAYTRRAGVSSFGAGGANAHLILEEFQESEFKVQNSKFKVEGSKLKGGPQLIVLSAANQDRLKIYAAKMVEFIEHQKPARQTAGKSKIENIAYTLQEGREAMDERLAAVVVNREELKEKLIRFIQGESEIKDFFRGNAIDGGTSSDSREAAMEKDLIRLAQAWVSGARVEWSLLHGDARPNRIPLPTYPFAKDRCWFPALDEAGVNDALQTLPAEKMEPLSQPGAEFENFYFQTEWVEKKITGSTQPLRKPMVLFDTAEIRRDLLAKRIKTDVVLVKPGLSYRRQNEHTFTVDPNRPDDYKNLIKALSRFDPAPRHFIHLWSQGPFSETIKDLHRQIERGLFSVFHLCRAMMDEKIADPVNILYLFKAGEDAIEPQYAAMGGFLKTLNQENPRIRCKTVALPKLSMLPDIVPLEFQDASDMEIRYRKDLRETRRIVEMSLDSGFDPDAESGFHLRQDGVYLITGGTGGLGFIFAEQIARQVKASLILCGRTALEEQREQKLETLRTLGADALYVPSDITNRADVQQLMDRIRSRFGRIDGIIHAAGVIRDSYVLKKQAEEMSSVLAPKIFGTLNLDEATQNESIDFFLLFSSITGLLGNPGQSDYAYANCFMDGFAAWREKQRAEGRRFGKTLSIGWPLWSDGGMSLSQEALDVMRVKTGMTAIPTDHGIKAWRRLLSQPGIYHGAVVYGHKDRVRSFFYQQDMETVDRSDRSVAVDSKVLFDKTESFLKELLAGILKISFDKIDTRINLERYGIDSLSVNRFNLKMEDLLGPLPKTLLFENQTLKALTQYLVDHYPFELATAFDLHPSESVTFKQPSVKLRKESHQKREAHPSPPARADIAVIGISGRYPMADGIDQFWENLKQGRDCITEIPPGRWDNRKWYHPDPVKSEEGKIYCKWGGFIEDADKFDPLFFHISPREAEILDPQERLFLEIAWTALEDAGYCRKDIQGMRVGVYVGVTSNTYLLWGPDAKRSGNNSIPQSLPWSIANRVSYVFNFRGPSLPVDTACSASLYAVHLACESLLKGETNMALAGGVNLYLHPSKYVQMCQSGMLSPTGRCKSFGAGGDGFVPGEGVGAVLLKPLSEAEADGDHIYGVIKASAVNHGGRTTGYTVPNPNAQAELISMALEKSGLDPKSITYIEAHGTGTELGDPVEVRGLAQAFGSHAQAEPYCAIGSSKSNIGHLESASGIAGLTKVLLQMKYRHLVPSLHAETLNPNIDLENSAFYVQRSYSEWKQPVLELNGQLTTAPRRAGISSFGAGGANAHLIVEEYQEKEFRGGNSELKAQSSKLNDEPQIIVLSARTEDRLKAYAAKMVEFFSQTENPKSKIQNIAYTLQVGRDAMAARLAVVVGDTEELMDKLQQFADGKKAISNFYYGLSTTSQKTAEMLLDGREGEAFVKIVMEEQKLGKLAQLWVSGVDIDWTGLNRDRNGKRISLPTYPFLRERYWIAIQPVDSAGEIPLSKETDRSLETDCLYYEPVWTEAPLTAAGHSLSHNGGVLLLDRDNHRVEPFRKTLNADIVLVTPGNRFGVTDDGDYTIRPDQVDDYRQLFKTLTEENRLPGTVAHFWSQDAFLSDERSLDALITAGFRSVFYLSQMLMAHRTPWTTQLLYLYPDPSDSPQPQYAAVSGFAKTLRLENPDLCCKTIAVSDFNDATDAALFELKTTDSLDIRYEGPCRHVRRLQEIKWPPDSAIGQTPWVRDGGVYLITGGAGGLGLHVARQIAETTKATVILTGRSDLSPLKQKEIDRLNAGDAEIVYLRSDVSKREVVDNLIPRITSAYGELNGIFHCAGIIRDSFILRKTTEEMEAVLSAKVKGTVFLDESTQKEPLDFFITFSAAAGLLGNIGQSDYAYANRFMDHFARLREIRRCSGKRNGRTLSVAWPFWEAGGMQMPADSLQTMLKQTGLIPLPISDGLAALKTAVQMTSCCQCLVAYGVKDKIRTYMDHAFTPDTGAPQEQTDVDTDLLMDHTEGFLLKAMAALLKLTPQKIDVLAGLEEYGLDSILINRFNAKMEELLGPLPKTLLFEHSNLHELAGYLTHRYRDRLIDLFRHQMGGDEIRKGQNVPEVAPTSVPSGTRGKTAASSDFKDGEKRPVGSDSDIAIIGISGRYPMATDLESFWQNLVRGRDCITEIPRDRWDYRPFFDPDPAKSREGKIYCKWGGFIADADRFDPLFFNIPPGDAELIDPQERLFLEAAWSVMEDAGYTRSRLSDSSVGVFVGVTTNTYQLWGPDMWRSGNNGIPTSYPWSIANRVSYCFNFNGPSMPVDTACSASLSAIHLACESIRKGESHMVLAGGVNLYLHPAKFIQLCQMGMLSPTGRCRTFGEGADGFVPGEGVGAVLLKPLDRAVADGDRIYAVIKGSGVNHGGKTNGYTVPNPNAQAALISKVMEKAGIDPGTISYLEAHGTGTALGDPVEIRGLTKAFRPYSTGRQYCAIGSVKTNIGHLEAAAGIAGITKIALQMKHKKLAPSLHCEAFNPKIDFNASPFYVQTEAADWKTQQYPRRAAISSFGAGGANAHVILEEYQEKGFRVQGSGFRDKRSELKAESSKLKGEPQLIVLSAKNEERLKVYVKAMIDYIAGMDKQEIQNPKSKIQNIAYTLQVGREAMRERLAVCVSSIDELKEKLTSFVNGESGIEGFFRGNAKAAKKEKTSIDSIIFEKNFEKAAQLWVSGNEIDWNLFYTKSKPRIISLPTYPFIKKRYWLPETATALGESSRNTEIDGKLHPLLEVNASTLKEQKFKTGLNGNEFFLSDHVVNGEKTLPGVAYLEMARAAGEMSEEREVSAIRNMVWTRPVHVSKDPVDLFVQIYPGSGTCEFEVYTVDDRQERQVHAQGRLSFVDSISIKKPGETVDLEAIRARCPEIRDGAACYELFEESGLRYGPAFRSIRKLFVGKTEVLSLLVLPETVARDANRFVLNPALMDGAFQTVSGLVAQASGHTPHLPFALEAVTLCRPLDRRCYAHVVRVDSSKDSTVEKFDVRILNEAGEDLVSMRNFTIRTGVKTGPSVSSDHQKEDKDMTKTGSGRARDVLAFLRDDLVAMVSEILKTEKDQIDLNDDISEYGFDSIRFTGLANIINETYGLEIMPTAFFEHPSLSDFSSYLSDAYPEPLVKHYGHRLPSISASQPAQKKAVHGTGRTTWKRFSTRGDPSGLSQSKENEPIAIIGMSGVMPQSEDPESFWKHLKAGDDLISEVPADRWDWKPWHGDPAKQANKTQSKWGGFIPDVDKFDCRFFGISPREADLMDPQQRIFLQTVWKTVEDAGYKMSELSGSQTGLFVGVAMNDYAELIGKHLTVMDAYVSTGMARSVLANRISYLFNFHGPSEPIDTACSSSLIAIHRAVEAIRSGSCDMALAGGVNVMLTPTVTISFDKAGMLSPDGRCKTFDQRADGYVRGEGVGALLLKPLTRAREDGDHIYAVIRATAENHGGHATSLTAPNPKAQAQLLISAYEKADIPPDTVGYIETHGTGTSLGDPIEINGLKEAFETLLHRNDLPLPQAPYCGLGAVKTNIGHLETAAGIAGVFKVLLAMKHRLLPANLHFETLNPYIQLEQSPFFIVSEAMEWKALRNDANETLPLRAGISSFGYGGANAHVVVEEYGEEEVRGQGSGVRGGNSELKAQSSKLKVEPQVIVLSAKNEERLRDYAQRMAEFLESAFSFEPSAFSLSDIAYTLQTGREAMTERLAMVVSDMDDLRLKLRRFVQNPGATDGLYRGNVKADKDRAELLVDGVEGEEFLRRIIEQRNYSKLAKLWVSGIEFNWKQLHWNGDQIPGRVSIPTYPFAKERHWITEIKPTAGGEPDATEVAVKLHPLVGRNASTFKEQKFTSHFTGDEFFIADHVIDGQHLLPGVAYLEMALAAGEIAEERAVHRLSRIVWPKPLRVSKTDCDLHIALYPDGDQAAFEVTTVDADGNRSVHAQGSLSCQEIDAAPLEIIDMDAVRSRCREKWDGDQCYEMFRSLGFDYGAGFQTIRSLHGNGSEALSQLTLPDTLKSGFDAFVLHPSLLDGALQTVMGVLNPSDPDRAAIAHLPFVLDELTWHKPLNDTCYVYVSRKADSDAAGMRRFDILILDDGGQVVVKIDNYTVKAVQPVVFESGPAESSDQELLSLFHGVADGTVGVDDAKHIIGRGGKWTVR